MLTIVPKLPTLLGTVPMGSGDLIIPQEESLATNTNYCDVTSKLESLNVSHIRDRDMNKISIFIQWKQRRKRCK